MKGVPTAAKSAFTRSFNKVGLSVKTSIMVEDFKKGKAKKKATVKDEDDLGDLELGGEMAEVRPTTSSVFVFSRCLGHFTPKFVYFCYST